MKTAIKQLKEEIANAIEQCESNERLNVYQPILHRLDYYEQKEREQIEAAFKKGSAAMSKHLLEEEGFKFCDDYYNQTYKSE